MTGSRPGVEHERLRSKLGAYLLGALPADEVPELEAHLAGCADCRAESQDLLPTARALEVLRGTGPLAAAPENPPADLGSRILAGIAAEDDAEKAAARRRRWLRAAGLTAIGGAAASVVLVAGLALAGPGRAPAAPQVPVEAVSVTVEQPGLATGVQAQAGLVNHTWGVEVKLEASGFTQGARYVVAVIGEDGTRYPAGEFVGTGDASMLCNLNSSVLRDAATGFDVSDLDGRVLLTSAFT